MAENDSYHLVLRPTAVSDIGFLKQAAVLLNKDEYTVRLLLASKIPKIAAHYQSRQTAEAVAQELMSLGLVAIICRDSQLKSHLGSYLAHSLKLQERAVEFHDVNNTIKTLSENDLFLILKGT